MPTESSSNKACRDSVRRVICTDLFGVADRQFASHVLQLGQSGVQAAFLAGRLKLAGLRLRQRAQQPQNRQNFLCDLL